MVKNVIFSIHLKKFDLNLKMDEITKLVGIANLSISRGKKGESIITGL